MTAFAALRPRKRSTATASSPVPDRTSATVSAAPICLGKWTPRSSATESARQAPNVRPAAVSERGNPRITRMATRSGTIDTAIASAKTGIARQMKVESIERATSAAAAILPETETDPICQGAALEEDCMTTMDPEFRGEDRVTVDWSEYGRMTQQVSPGLEVAIARGLFVAERADA